MYIIITLWLIINLCLLIYLFYNMFRAYEINDMLFFPALNEFLDGEITGTLGIIFIDIVVCLFFWPALLIYFIMLIKIIMILSIIVIILSMRNKKK